ncbi:MAG TPA: protein kinase, partial [Candidatus Nitrosotenuis sp.]|nr:protein kinase [Candidatus Nitrosotenuis sp.]
MSLNPGTRIGSYEVLSLVGAGGMGEVYRAKDKKLNRDVALKVIPESFAQDAQRMTRFQREAQVLASLNHPNIATIHGLEEFGHTHALVMELVEGATLADRIAQGPLPLEEALPIARQIAEALEYAHERGVIHRDLKPANIKLTSDGKVKILDFGLAKAMSEDVSPADNATSPTLSLAATKAGIILGTAAYMSPEQAKGKAVDRRADIWAFGVVLCEMLTGAQLYTGETASETMAAVIFKEPSLDMLPASVPQRLRKLLQRCLTREPRQRLQAIGEARILIEDVMANPSAESVPEIAGGTPAVQIPVWRRALPWALCGVLAVALAFSVWTFWPAPKLPVRMSVETGADASLFLAFGASTVLSPDGRVLAFVARESNRANQIYVRSMDQLKATPLAGTEGARDQFFSPDGQWIAFFAGGKLKKVAVSGGAVGTLCDATDDRGGSWSEHDQIVFTPHARSVLLQVSAAGGKPEALTEFDKAAGEGTHRWPQFLPGGKTILYTSHNLGGTFDNATISVLSLETKKHKTVLRGGSYARYLPSGHLLYMHEGALFAVPFDLSRLEVEGQPAPAVEGVITVSGNGGAQYTFSDSGSFVYVPGTGMGAGWQVLWLDGQGKLTPLRGVPGTYLSPRFSPDGTRLALEVLDGRQTDVQVYDWKRDTMSRLTFSQEYDGWPVWTPDGRRIAFNSQQDAQVPNLYWNRSDGTGQSQRLTESKNL